MDLLQMSLAAGILIVGIVAFRFFFLHRLPKRVMALLWEIVILRLLFPFVLPLPLPGIGSLGVVKEQPGIVKVEALWDEPPGGQWQGEAVTASVTTVSEEGNMVFRLVYCLGTGAMLIASFWLYYRDSQLFREGLPMSECEKQFLLAAVGEGDRKRMEKVKLQVSDRTATPITYGIFRQAIVFPRGICFQEQKEVGLCLAHELVHIRNHDNMKKVIAHLALCIHWFNPLVWVMYLLYNRDLELLCDEIVVRRAGSRQDYALALLSMAQQRAVGFRMGMGFGKNAVKERITAVMKWKKLTAASALGAVMAVTVALTVFVTDSSGTAGAADAAEYTLVWQNEAATADTAITADGEYVISVAYEERSEAASVGGSLGRKGADTVAGEGTESQNREESIESTIDEYGDFGLSVEVMEDDYQLYYQGEPVYFFADNRKQAEEGFSGKEFSGRLFLRPVGGRNGYTGVVTEYEDGKLKGVVQLSRQESAAYTKRWQ